ncbi:MAG TPA: flagellar basal body P-ring formation chaperone FlgA [bacterium]|nr:flagellar basal body P-ring formation chaperone FlgA [bacterium]
MGAGAQETPVASPAPQVLIRLPEKASVIGPEIRLGEIAEVITPDKGLSERLLRLVVAKAAPAGKPLALAQAALKIALYREGYDLKTFQFSGALTTQVVTASQAVKESALLADAKAFVAGQLKEDPANVDVQLSSADKSLLLPAGDLTTRFLPSFSGGYQGLTLLTVELAIDGREVRDLPLRLLINVMRPAVVTQAAVQAGDKFSGDNVALVRWPESKTPPNALRDLSGVLGRTANGFLPPKTVVALRDLYDPPVIHHGAEVSGVVRQGNVELQVSVRAIDDGKMNDVIRVENTDSHKLLKAKVLDEKTVLIQTDMP